MTNCMIDRGKFLLVMGGRDPLEENFGFGRVNISVDPSGPCGHAFVVSNKTVHVFVQFIPLLHVVPSAN